MKSFLKKDKYTRFIQESEEQFKIFDRIMVKVPEVPAEEIEEDIRSARRYYNLDVSMPE